MKIIFVLFGILIHLSVSLNAQSLEWAFKLEGNANDANAVVSDASGNVYTAGKYVGAVDFDPGAGTNILNANGGGGDSYIAKFDSEGILIWVETIPVGPGITDYISALYLDDNGYLYCTGTIAGGGFAAKGFVQKMVALSGNVVWFKSFIHPSTTGNFAVFANDVTVDSSGNVFVAGSFWLNTIFSSNPNIQFVSAGLDDAYIVKLDNSGNVLWVDAFGNTGSDAGISVAVDNAGDVYLAGLFEGTVDFDPGPGVFNLTTPGSNTRTFLVKLNGNGDLIRATMLSGNYPYPALLADDPGNLIMTSGDEIMKMDSSGTILWMKSIIAEYKSVTLDTFGNIVTTGNYSSSLNDLDPGPGLYTLPYSGYGDGFISKLNQHGDFLGAIGLNGQGYSVIDDIAVWNDKLYTAGTMIDSVDFDPSTGTSYIYAYGNQSFVWKLNQCGTLNPVQPYTGCDSLSINGYTYSNSGTYYQTFTDTTGCDSTIVLNLSINSTTYSALSLTVCDSVQVNGQFYTTTGNFDIYYTNSAGCDSIVQLSLVVNNSFADYTTITACDDYTFGGNILTASGVYTDSLVTITGCDSVHVLNLTIAQAVSNNLNVTACNDYFFDGNVITTSGVYTDSLVTYAGCDSVVILNLTINPLDTSVNQIGGTLFLNDSSLFCYWVDCNNGYQIIPGATGPFFTPVTNGSYAAMIFGSGCLDTSACFGFTNVGLSDPMPVDYISIFPNPFQSSVKMKFHVSIDKNNVVVELLNPMGQVVERIMDEEINEHTTEYLLNYSGLHPGIYYLKCTIGKAVFVKRIIKI